MMTSGLKAKFERLERSPRTVPAPSGSPEIVAIGVCDNSCQIDTIGAIALLKQSGIGLLRAKRTIEDAMSGGAILIELPKVADREALRRNFLAMGFTAKVRSRLPPDVQAIRERLGLTQEQFSLRFGLELDAVRNWEHRRRTPDSAARSLLKVIARFPDLVSDAQDDVGETA